APALADARAAARADAHALAGLARHPERVRRGRDPVHLCELDPLRDAVRLRVDTDEAAAAAVCDPEPAESIDDAVRESADLDGLRDAVGPRVDAADRPVRL